MSKLSLPITIERLIQQSLGECGRRQLIRYAVTSVIWIHLIRAGDDGGEHSVVQTYLHVSMKPSLKCARPVV